MRGGDTSVTDFFAAKTRAPLGEKFLPIVSAETRKLSLAEKYNAVAGKGSKFGLVRPEDANVEQYVTRKALDGLFLMIGQEEKKIRADPVGTGSAILEGGLRRPLRPLPASSGRARQLVDQRRRQRLHHRVAADARVRRLRCSSTAAARCLRAPISMNTNDGISGEMPWRSFWKRSLASTDS